MIGISDRKEAVKLINEAHKSGSRKSKACQEFGISVRTYERWTKDDEIKKDGRIDAKRPTPANKLSQEERAKVIEVINTPKFKSRPPSQIVPTLADEGLYIASESTFYRIMRSEGQQNHRGISKKPTRRIATTHKATSSNQVWCWDITWLKGPALGIYYYLYLIIDIYSRKIVGWEIHENESSENASVLVKKAHLREQVGSFPLVLHSDNGSPMKGSSLQETLLNLAVEQSYSRPRVSNDNAYSESIFKTCKYRPDYPYGGFSDLTKAREWVLNFVYWYNFEHKHSGLKFITPNQRHSGNYAKITTLRDKIYEEAKTKNPTRWSGKTRNWKLPEAVFLNPEKEKNKQEKLAS
jgi:putative transposase